MNDQELTNSPELHRESPKSANVRGYYKGFSLQVTVRDENVTVQPLVEKMIQIIDYMEEKGFEPSWNTQTNKQVKTEQDPDPDWIRERDKELEPAEEVQPNYCAIHNLPMKERKGPTGTFFSHATQLPNGKWTYCSGKGFPHERKAK